MYALLENGPLGKQQIETADTPPQVLHRETRFATHVYHLVGVEEDSQCGHGELGRAHEHETQGHGHSLRCAR